MKEYSIYDIIGPIMIGPSSSHTAGACRIGYTAGKIIKSEVEGARFLLYGSFARTYQGHGTDVALLGGFLGFKPDDERIRRSYEIADEIGFRYEFIPCYEDAVHPNTVRILTTDKRGYDWDIVGISIGGGKMTIVSINGVEVDFTGDYNTLVTEHSDHPGMLSKISQILSDKNINIANMRLFRESKGDKAIGIIETDERIPQCVINILSKSRGIRQVKVIEKV